MRIIGRAIWFISLLTPYAAAQDAGVLKDTTQDGRLAPLLENLGDLHVAITTSSPDARRFFDQGTWLMHIWQLSCSSAAAHNSVLEKWAQYSGK
jgi:hypothetical protein